MTNEPAKETPSGLPADLLRFVKLRAGLETLETRKRDALDFHDLHVETLLEIVRRAFEAGRREEAAREVSSSSERLTRARAWLAKGEGTVAEILAGFAEAEVEVERARAAQAQPGLEPKG